MEINLPREEIVLKMIMLLTLFKEEKKLTNQQAETSKQGFYSLERVSKRSIQKTIDNPYADDAVEKIHSHLEEDLTWEEETKTCASVTVP